MKSKIGKKLNALIVVTNDSAWVFESINTFEFFISPVLESKSLLVDILTPSSLVKVASNFSASKFFDRRALKSK